MKLGKPILQNNIIRQSALTSINNTLIDFNTIHIIDRLICSLVRNIVKAKVNIIIDEIR